MSTADGLTVYFGHEPRDPKKQPRFGDVFQRGAWPRTAKVLYIRSLGRLMDDDWLGLALDSEWFDQRVQPWIKLDEGWEFIETIAVHAIAADFSGMSYPAVMRALATGEPVTITVGSEP